MPGTQDKNYDTDRLETTVPSSSDAADDTPNFPADSPSSASDAGLDDELLDEDGSELLVEEDLNAADGEFDEAPKGGIVEIPMSDISGPAGDLTAPEMSDLNVPGEIDIEELDEHALDNTDLPADARLDPLEE